MDNATNRIESFEFMAKRGFVDALESSTRIHGNRSASFYTFFKVSPMLANCHGVEAEQYLPRLKSCLEKEVPVRFVRDRFEMVSGSTQPAPSTKSARPPRRS